MSDKPREYPLANHPNEDTEWLEAMEQQKELERLQSLQPTPGPWQMGDGFSVAAQCTIIGNMDDEGGNGHTVICDVNEDPDAYYANARLIAAAPDLFACLTAAVEIIDKWIEPETMGVVRSGDGVLGHYLRDEYLMNFRAALQSGGSRRMNGAI